MDKNYVHFTLTSLFIAFLYLYYKPVLQSQLKQAVEDN